ncbi:MAG: phosphoribosylformylglycinamidine synthase, partial [Clostridiaceae bacterium]|nr:phosphoribosylformylglycinamidine synthase [Clostridiaceae bacterium]
AVSDIEGMNLLRRNGALLIGQTMSDREIVFGGQRVDLETVIAGWQNKLGKVFPTDVKNKPEIDNRLTENTYLKNYSAIKNKSEIKTSAPYVMNSSKARPKVFIPVFPGTNCEYDTQKAFENAGASTDILVVRNLTHQAITETIAVMERRIAKAQIIMLPGGFSGGDEPEGSGKFIAAALRNPALTEQIRILLQKRDGLMLGICNGFQALVKLGLLPYGDITDLTSDSPTLTFNSIGRHVSTYVTTRVVSNRSPWLALTKQDELYQIPVSHGEGRFTASPEILSKLIEADQVATQYVDLNGRPSIETAYNPNGSVAAIEGIISADGRIFGKMGHSERYGTDIAKNIPGNKDQHLFEAGVKWFE